jgi:hypothetical protein
MIECFNCFYVFLLCFLIFFMHLSVASTLNLFEGNVGKYVLVMTPKRRHQDGG